MAKTALIWLAIICLIGIVKGGSLKVPGLKGNGICKDDAQKTRFILRSLAATKSTLRNCLVIVGNLQLWLEFNVADDFVNVSFPYLREITGFFVMYRVKGLDSIGQLFPNLSRIRGTELLNNYALIIYDMFNLTEIGLYSLLKIDRGGVIVWDLPQACFVDTINWRVIAPKSRHVIAHPEKQVHCNFPCTCSDNDSLNRCWNNKMCQLYIEGPEKVNCSDQCFGCRKTKSDECFLCSYYTHQLKCVSQCPEDTLILEENNYCISLKECKDIGGWEFNKTCAFECPMNFARKNDKLRGSYCEPCTGCHEICHDQIIQTTAAIQAAENCVYINGSLEIHVRVIPDAMEELQRLQNIEEVTDYILIYGSLTIKSLNFLSGLRRIRGRKLKNKRYSFLLHDMENLWGLLPEEVTKNLTVDKGSVQIYGNPKLCINDIKKLRKRFPEPPDDMDIPKGSNGYGGVCNEVLVDIQTRILNETNAAVLFPITNINLEYSVLYVRIPYNTHGIIVPETCSDSEWLSVDVHINSTSKYALIELTSLRPASNYAICIETHDPVQGTLARTNIFNFSTMIGIPEPPFIIELVASFYDAVVLRWLDHEDYKSHITHYKLEVILIDVENKQFHNINFCIFDIDDEPVLDYPSDRHALVMRPPPEYGKSCESMCGVLSSVTKGALVDEFFDVCNDTDFECNLEEDSIVENSTFKSYIRTLNLHIEKRPENGFQVGGLAPYRDYSFKLRACAFDKCSRSARGVVKTLRTKDADVPTITHIEGYETGLVVVNWKHPEITNGPILTYSIEVLPQIGYNLQLLPQSWCILSNETSFTLQSSPAKKYKVRVCSKTLPSIISCSDWIIVADINVKFWWWSGFTFGILLFATSFLFGCYRKINHRNDRQPLIDTDVTF